MTHRLLGNNTAATVARRISVHSASALPGKIGVMIPRMRQSPSSFGFGISNCFPESHHWRWARLLTTHAIRARYLMHLGFCCCKARQYDFDISDRVASGQQGNPPGLESCASVRGAGTQVPGNHNQTFGSELVSLSQSKYTSVIPLFHVVVDLILALFLLATRKIEETCHSVGVNFGAYKGV